MVKKHRGYIAKTTSRMIVIFLFFCIIISTLGYTLINNLFTFNKMKDELGSLDDEKTSLIDKGEELEADIKRLSDPLYVARYAREKYLYSKDGEIILRIEE